MKVRVLDAISEAPRAAWNALLRPLDAPVLRHEWIDAMESSGSAVESRGWIASHLTLWRGPQLIAACPAFEKHHSMGEYVYDFGWANAAQQLGVEYYPKLLVGLPLSPLTARRFLIAPGEDVAAIRKKLLSELDALAKDRGCSSIHVLFPPDDEAAWLEGENYFRRSTMQYHWRNPGYGSYDDYLSRFDSKRRNQFKRERGAAATQGLTLRTVRSGELTKEHAQLAWKFYEATAGRYSWGPVQLTKDFFHRAFAAMPDAIELVVAEHGPKKEVVAGAFNLFNTERLYGRYWGCFQEFPFLHFHVCLYHSIDDAVSRGLKVFEPGAGGEHKISRGFEPTTIHSAHRIFNKRLDGAIRDFCRRERAHVADVTSQSEELSGLKPWPLPAR